MFRPLRYANAEHGAFSDPASAKKLGEGGYGSVTQRTDMRTGRTLAVKVLRQTASPECGLSVDKYSELQAFQELRHLNVIRCEAIFLEAGRLCLGMEVCNGGSLAGVIERNVSLSLVERKRIYRQLLEGLAYLHANHIVHCDLKPDNVLIRSMTPPELRRERLLVEGVGGAGGAGGAAADAVVSCSGGAQGAQATQDAQVEQGRREPRDPGGTQCVSSAPGASGTAGPPDDNVRSAWRLGVGVDPLSRGAAQTTPAPPAGPLASSASPAAGESASADLTVLKITDFGLSLTLGRFPETIDLIYTHARFGWTDPYRPPEVFGCTKILDSKADMWSLGLTFLQLVTRRVQFNTQSSLVPRKIYDLLGRPWVPVEYRPPEGEATQAPVTLYTSRDVQGRLPWWPEFARLAGIVEDPALAAQGPALVPRKPPLSAALERIRAKHFESQEEFDFIMAFLQYDPASRLSAAEALRHPFLQDPRVLEGDGEDSLYRIFRGDVVDRSLPRLSRFEFGPRSRPLESSDLVY